MQMFVRGVIFGVDGKGQSLDGAHMQRRDLLDVPFFRLHLELLGFDPFFFQLQPTQI